MWGESFFCPFIVIASPPCRAVIPRACGGSSTPRLLGSITDVSGILGRPVKPGDDTEDVALAFSKTQLRNPAARCARVVHEFSAPKTRGRRECRVRAAPAVSCAKCTKKCAHEHTGSAETLRHPPRNGFTAYTALSSATNSCCHRRCRLDGYSDPVGSMSPPTA
jgi:hypothetical protein